MLLKKIFRGFLVLACHISIGCFAQKARLVLPLGHTQIVSTSAFSPGGDKVITGSWDGTAKIWDVASGKLLADLSEHKSRIRTALFSPNGKLALTASDDGTAKIWDIVSGALLHDLVGHKNKVYSAQFSADGNKVVTASEDKTAIIWDAFSGQPLDTLTGHTEKVVSASFSRDGSKIVTASWDQTAIIWNADNGDSIHILKKHNSFVYTAQFSPDGKQIVTASRDKKAIIWDVASGQPLSILVGHADEVVSAVFSPDAAKVLTVSKDGNAKIWSAETGAIRITYNKSKGHAVMSGQFGPFSDEVVTTSDNGFIRVWDISGNTIREIRAHTEMVNDAAFSPDGKKLVTASNDKSAKIFDKETGDLLVDLKGHSSPFNTVAFSPDGKTIITTGDDHYVRLWDAVTGNLFVNIKGLSTGVFTAQLNPAATNDSVGGKNLVTSFDDTVKVWDAGSGVLLSNLIQPRRRIANVLYSADGKKIITANYDGSGTIWNAETGQLQLNLPPAGILDANLSPDNKILATYSNANTVLLWNANTGTVVNTLKEHRSKILSIAFSPDGKKLLTTSWDAHAMTWNTATGARELDLKNSTGHIFAVNYGSFSPKCADDPEGGRYIATASNDKTAKIWDAVSGDMLADLKGHTNDVTLAKFSPDGKTLLTTSNDKTTKIWEVPSGRLLHTLTGHNGVIRSAAFSPDGNTIVTASQDGTAKIWNTASGELQYTFFAVDSTDFLVVDKGYRYDGSEDARKLLYFTCENEVIGLDQVKDQLWVPKLAESIHSERTITAKTLNDLQLCGLVPLLEEVANDSVYHFQITTRRGDLGETVLYVNGIEARRYQPQDLVKNDGHYDLYIHPSDLTEYFASNSRNIVSVKSFTADNMISSRGPEVPVVIKDNDFVYPNLYAVMIGVSDYDGDSLDLKYAAKDAADISNALSNSAKKLLNTDGKEHVFIYNLNSMENPSQTPRKKNIQQFIDDIAAKTNANDIFLIFFAGHGMMAGPAEKKQFYFLTADASTFAPGPLPDVGISTAELTDWIKPQRIKAQKRILIFDACNSGQAINDIIANRNGGPDMLGARGQEESQQIKIIDKLNEKTGLFILSASASTQKAYESGRYSQGLLTYSLLKAIKQQPDILEDNKYLDVSRWFNAAEKTVKEMARASGREQDPQLVSNTNFNIGQVDKEVISKIILPKEKPLVTNCNFQNDDIMKGDDLALAELTNQELNAISASDDNIKKPAFLFIEGYKNPDAYKMIGRYTVVANKVNLTMIIMRSDPITSKEEKQKIELSGSKDEPAAFARNIAQAISDWVEKHN